MIRGLPSLARLAFGPSLELRPHTAGHCQHLRILLPTRAYSRREDLHEDANARFN
jgi:hypothetical protein